jgi:hypothetical protein
MQPTWKDYRAQLREDARFLEPRAASLRPSQRRSLAAILAWASATKQTIAPYAHAATVSSAAAEHRRLKTA